MWWIDCTSEMHRLCIGGQTDGYLAVDPKPWLEGCLSPLRLLWATPHYYSNLEHVPPYRPQRTWTSKQECMFDCVEQMLTVLLYLLVKPMLTVLVSVLVKPMLTVFVSVLVKP